MNFGEAGIAGKINMVLFGWVFIFISIVFLLLCVKKWKKNLILGVLFGFFALGHFNLGVECFFYNNSNINLILKLFLMFPLLIMFLFLIIKKIYKSEKIISLIFLAFVVFTLAIWSYNLLLFIMKI